MSLLLLLALDEWVKTFYRTCPFVERRDDDVFATFRQTSEEEMRIGEIFLRLTSGVNLVNKIYKWIHATTKFKRPYWPYQVT